MSEVKEIVEFGTLLDQPFIHGAMVGESIANETRPYKINLFNSSLNIPIKSVYMAHAILVVHPAELTAWFSKLRGQFAIDALRGIGFELAGASVVTYDHCFRISQDDLALFMLVLRSHR